MPYSHDRVSKIFSQLNHSKNPGKHPGFLIYLILTTLLNTKLFAYLFNIFELLSFSVCLFTIKPFKRQSFSYYSRLKKASLPAYLAVSPSTSSILISWLYLATLSDLVGAPVLI